MRLQLCFRPHLNQRCTCKVMDPQSHRNPNCGKFGISTLGVGLVARHKVYYKGEGGGFPQVRALVSLVSPSLPVICPSTISAPVMH
jgi:hypothetical protein